MLLSNGLHAYEICLSFNTNQISQWFDVSSLLNVDPLKMKPLCENANMAPNYLFMDCNMS
jgi:hypothetical protein